MARPTGPYIRSTPERASRVSRCQFWCQFVFRSGAPAAASRKWPFAKLLQMQTFTGCCISVQQLLEGLEGRSSGRPGVKDVVPSA
jgi:hypothetical protein